jgi:hypothetical protein
VADVYTKKFTIDVNLKNGTLQPDEIRRVTVEVRVDFEGIAKELGRKAVRSRSGRSIEIGGLVRVVNLSATHRSVGRNGRG